MVEMRCETDYKKRQQQERAKRELDQCARETVTGIASLAWMLRISSSLECQPHSASPGLAICDSVTRTSQHRRAVIIAKLVTRSLGETENRGRLCLFGLASQRNRVKRVRLH